MQLLRDPLPRRRIGAAAQHAVRERFLLTRLLEEWLDLLGSFRTRYELKAAPDA